MVSTRTGFRQNQQGMVSFTIVIIMMLVISLIVISFSRVVQRNSREALDRQLSAQAFYAAESGVNVTKATIKALLASGTPLPLKQTCPNDYNSGSAITDLNSANNVRYTCVLVNPSPNDVEFPASPGSSVLEPLNGNGNLKTLVVKWSYKDGGSKTTCSVPSGTDAQHFPPADNSGTGWYSDCDFGVLRLDLVKNPSDTANIIPNTVTLYLSPHGFHGNNATVNFSTQSVYVVSGADLETVPGTNDNTGKVCSSGTCQVVLTMPDDTATYALRASTIYNDAKTVKISGTTDSGAATFTGAQAIVDVTGQSGDELRRIQVRMALSLTPLDGSIPPYALSGSGSICKHFSLLPADNITSALGSKCN